MCTLYFYLTSSNIIKRSDIFFVDITIAGTLFILGYWQLITPEVADELKIVNNDIQQIDANEITQNETIEQSQKSTITYSELFIKINKYIASQSAYLNPDLGIAEISEYIGENITNISKCIRTETKDNFYQYINSYRVYHMIELMNISENHQYTLDYIANTSGIKSRTTLSKYFNAICEMSPSSLRNKIIKKEVDTNVFLSSLIERYKYLSILLQEADNKQLISEQQTKSVSI
jgi:YesN/AraC family two-component response regulator